MHIILWLVCLAVRVTARGDGLPPRDANTTTPEAPLPTGAGSYGFNTSAYCDLQMAQYFRTYNPTGSYTTSTITDYIGYDDTGQQTGDIITQYYSTRTITFTEEAYMAYQLGAAKPPCCHTCQMHAGTIEFFWWPGLAANATATASQYVTKPANNTAGPVTAIGTNGFIFTSPTVYMAFSSLYAKNFCGTVGQVWTNTTIGFHPSEISTINAYTVTYTGHTTLTHSDSTVTAVDDIGGTRPPPSPLQYTDLAQNCSTISGYAYFPDDPQNDVNGGWDHDPCHPVLAIPTGLITMQQAWIDASCTVLDGYGAYDPPVALTAALSANQPTLPAQPGSTSTRMPASVTSTYTALPDSKPATYPSSSISTPADEGDSSETTWTMPRVTYNIPMIQHTDSKLDTPETESTTRKFKPHLESTASAFQQRPISSISVEVYTIMEVTADHAGSTSILTRTTEAVAAQPVKTITQATTQAGGYVVMHTILQVNDDSGHTGSAYTILRESTLPNGKTTAVPAVVVLSPTTQAPPIITLGSQVVTGDTSGQHFIIAEGTTLSLNGPSVTVDGTAYALKTDSDGDTLLVGAGLASSTSSSGNNVAGYIMSALGEMSQSSQSSEKSTSTEETAGRTSATVSPSSAASGSRRPGDYEVHFIVLMITISMSIYL